MEILLDVKRLQEEIEKDNLYEIFDIIDHVDDEHFELLVEDYEQLNEILHENMKKHGCLELIGILDKQMYHKKHGLILDQERYKETKKVLLDNSDSEKEYSFSELLQKKKFNSKLQLCVIAKGEGQRFVDRKEDWKELLILFANVTMKEEAFANKIVRIYDSLVFDEEIAKSMKKLTAGLNIRRAEILYHLYCIEKLFPDINKGSSGNVDAGKKFESICGIPCSPERKKEKRELLTKEIGNDKIICEMHTKMEKYGGQKPDRIYFNPCVEQNIKFNGHCIKGKIFIYQITKHI